MKYGNKFIQDFSTINLSKEKKFYEKYKDLSNLPIALANLPWTYNCILLEKIKEDNM